MTRYHSLVVAREGLPTALEITAESPDGEIMGLRHRGVEPGSAQVVGVQFHPEAVLTEGGHALLANFLALDAVSPTRTETAVSTAASRSTAPLGSPAGTDDR